MRTRRRRSSRKHSRPRSYRSTAPNEDLLLMQQINELLEKLIRLTEESVELEEKQITERFQEINKIDNLAAALYQEYIKRIPRG